MITPNKRQIHSIEITSAANNGVILRVGCENFVFKHTKEDIIEMCTELANYLIEPRLYELHWKKEKRHFQEPNYACGGGVAPPQPLDGGYIVGGHGTMAAEETGEAPAPPVEVPDEELTPDQMARRVEEEFREQRAANAFPDPPRAG